MTEYEKHVVDLQPLVRMIHNGPIDARFGENATTLRQVVSMARSLTSRMSRDCENARMEDYDIAIVEDFARSFDDLAAELRSVIPANTYQMAAE